MSFNTNGDPRSFFYYKGDYYINGTEIILTDEYANSHKCNGLKIWKYATYHHQVTYNGRVAYFFCANKMDWLSLHKIGMTTSDFYSEYATYFVMDALDVDRAIQEFVRPIKLSKAETDAIKEALVKPKSDFDNPALMVMWIIYIFVLVASLIFRQFYLIWIVASVIFFKYRREML